jgi:hypothetical protein
MKSAVSESPHDMIDFLCIGAQKAGTTWLMSNLSRHPKVWTPRFIKEVHYFDAIHLPYGKNRVLRSYERRGKRMIAKKPEMAPYFARVVDPGFAFTDAWYEYIFSIGPKKAKKGECTPLYCALPDEGVAHVRRVAPDVKLVYMIRDPFDRAMSLFRMAMDGKNITNGSELVHKLEDDLFKARGDYQSNIARWEKHFPPSQILYLPFGMIKKDPTAAIRAVEQHLGLKPHDGYPRLNEPIHATKKEGKTIGDDVIEGIRTLAEPQDRYIKERFGDEFHAMTK